jgi:hypothetical protein
MANKRSLVYSLAFFTLVGYLVFTALAWQAFPGAYSPLHNWLSDLGSNALNPRGAILYNLGILATGAFTFLFFLFFSVWRIAGNRVQAVMLALARIFGCLGALSMLFSALFPINTGAWHGIFSAGIYILLGTGFAFSAAALRYHRTVPRSLVVMGILVAAEDLVFGIFLNIPILEWVTVALFLGYILILGLVTRRQPAVAE